MLTPVAQHGMGGGIVYNQKEFEDVAARGLSLSMNSEILIERSILGWKEFELEVMRDLNDNVVIICSIENFGLQQWKTAAQPVGRFSRRYEPVSTALRVVEGRFDSVCAIDPCHSIRSQLRTGSSRMPAVMSAVTYLAFCHCYP